jgi:hypothetical protein
MSDKRPHNEAELVEILGAIDVRAPQALHDQVQTLVDGAVNRREERHGGWRTPRRALLLNGACAALLVLAIALALTLAGGGATRLTVSETAALSLRTATTGPPPESPHARGALAAAVDGIAFPNWSYAFGYSASGARVDRVGGQMVTTVFYANARGQRVGYAIAAAGPVPHSGGGVVHWRGGTPYRVLRDGDASVVTWVRDGHLCVLAARDVPGVTLLGLASWQPRSE